MTRRQPADLIEHVELVTQAARYIAGHLAWQHLLETTDPHGWTLARRLGELADSLNGGRLAAEVEATLPKPRQPRRQETT